MSRYPGVIGSYMYIYHTKISELTRTLWSIYKVSVISLYREKVEVMRSRSEVMTPNNNRRKGDR